MIVSNYLKVFTVTLEKQCVFNYVAQLVWLKLRLVKCLNTT